LLKVKKILDGAGYPEQFHNKGSTRILKRGLGSRGRGGFIGGFPIRKPKPGLCWKPLAKHIFGEAP